MQFIVLRFEQWHYIMTKLAALPRSYPLFIRVFLTYGALNGSYTSTPRY